MTKDNFITEVQFRKFKAHKDLFVTEGEIIAVFPYVIYGGGVVMSYQHIGQHGGCDALINTITELASESEYKPLYDELTSLGYNLKVITRRNHSKYLKAYYEAKKLTA
jgi:hypothetical protein